MDLPLKEAVAQDASLFWNASEHHETIRDFSHWQGHGRWNDQNEWLAVGERHFALYEQLCSVTKTARPLARMLEWGPGGGANAFRFAEEFEEFIGVDISTANLQECGRQLEAKNTRFQSVPIDIQKPSLVLQEVKAKIDFFLCTAVMQHMPSQQAALEVTRIARELLKPGGLALMQTRYDDGSAALACKNSDYFKNAITFTSFTIDGYWQAAETAGFQPLSVVLDRGPHYAFYLLQAR